MPIWLILFAALVLRVISLNQSLWLDEAINVVFAQKLTLWDFLTKYSLADFHPPGYFLLLWIWIRIFGNSEIAVRLPSVLFGVGTVLLIYLIGKQLFSKKIGLLSALFLAIAPLHIYYSQEARMYSFAAFAVCLSFYFFIRILQRKYILVNILGYIFSTTLVLYSDYLAYFALVAQGIYILFYQRDKLNLFLKPIIFILMLFLPWLIFFPSQLLNGQHTAKIVSGWGEVVGGASVKELLLLPVKILVGRVSLNQKILYGLILGIISLPYLLAFRTIFNKPNNKVALILSWVLVPAIVGFLISFYLPIFAYFRFTFILPAFYLLLAVGVTKLNERLMTATILLIVFFELTTSLTYLLNPNFQRENWKDAISFIEKHSDKNTVVLSKNNVVVAPLEYYAANKFILKPAFKTIPVKSINDIVDLRQELTNNNDVYLFDYLVDITDNQKLLEGQLIKTGFKLKQTFDFKGVGFLYLYSR